MDGFADHGRLGLTRGRVKIADSEPCWQSAFEQLAAQLRGVLTGLRASVEHVGSTAVPGLAAKPIIDIAIGIRGGAGIDHVIGAVEPLGYIYRGDAGSDGGHLFVLDDQPDHRIAHLHVVSAEDPQWQRYLAFRDLLRQDPLARADYENLKRQLAIQFPEDRKAYTAAKKSFISAQLPPEPPAAADWADRGHTGHEQPETVS
jgi:GrpB-like predicted nucleotidyltransferase (UPF0157 family)